MSEVKLYKAENERLQESNARLRRSLNEAIVYGNRQTGRAERLAEALRELLEIGDRYTGDQDEDAAIYCAVTDNARAALDQEGGNG